MNTIDWYTYKFHCSSLSNLMVKSRKADEPSETTKSFLRELWVQETFGRQKIEMIGNKYTTKGIMCETDSIELFERVTGKTYFKNNEQLENEYIVGTPDLKKPDLVDIKTSWDLFTYAGVDEKKAMKDYYYQLAGYMWLTGEESATLAYCLVNTPDILANDELYRLSFKLPDDQTELYRHNYIYDDIPEDMRVKQYHIAPLDMEGVIESMREATITARTYLAGLTL